MGFLFFVILIIIIVSAANSSKNNKGSISYQENSYSTPTYNTYNSYYRSSTPKLKFHSKSDTVNLFGYSITNSLFYTCDSKSDMPFAINIKSNPSFGVTPSEGLNYWPNYNQISKTQQGYFIKWLSDGKPFIEELGYAYIYYYGLEYRALVEKQDQKEVLFEVIELINTFPALYYGYSLICFLIFLIKEFNDGEKQIIIEFLNNNSTQYVFQYYWNSILYKIDHDYFIENLKFNGYVANYLKQHLYGRRLELLNYYIEKIFDKFKKEEWYSIKNKFYDYHTATLGLFPNSKVTIAYENIEPSEKIQYPINYAYENIRNIQNIKKFDSSTNDLNEMEILSYLPSYLKKNIYYDKIIDYGDKAIIKISDLTNIFNIGKSEKLTLKQSEAISNLCDTYGYCIEPDAKIIQKPYKINTNVIVYKDFNYQGEIKDYTIASLFTDIGYQIALEDNELLQVEIAYIENYIKKEFNLSPSERYRLQMRGELLVHTKAINTSETIKKLIKMLDDTGKETIAKYIISVAMADGIVKDSELKILQKIFKQLDFSDDYLNSILSELINSNDDVVTVEKGTSIKKKGSKIPTEIETDEKVELKLDAEKLEKIKINTSEIHNVLQEIFAEEEAEVLKSEPVEKNSPENEDNIEIESSLQGLVNIIIEKENWTRNELLNAIQNKGMMLSSAIDEINEWSEEEYGDFLVEEDNNVYIVNEDVVNLIRK